MGLRKGNAAKPSGSVYDVFAKTRKEQALHHIGDVLAPGKGLAKAYAYQMYQESTWHDMLAVPRARIVTIVDDGESLPASVSSGSWVVCGRKEKAEPLELLGPIDAAGDLAAAAAEAFGEGWLELAAWPDGSAVVVLLDTEGKVR